jgi:DNA-binding NarL/FixJ family response regulator
MTDTQQPKPTSSEIPLTTSRTSRARVRVLIVDDHAVLRQALRLLLESHDEDVVGDVANGREAVQLSEEITPDVVLMDVVMPGLNRLDATRQIRKRCPDTRVLVLSGYEEEEQTIEALRAGAGGYLIKESDTGELLLAIQAVLRGNTYFSSSLSERDQGNGFLMRARSGDARAGFDRLTDREREVLQLIADQLVISVKTVGAHKTHIMSKLGARNRTDLIRYAISRGTIGLDPMPQLRAG